MLERGQHIGICTSIKSFPWRDDKIVVNTELPNPVNSCLTLPKDFSFLRILLVANGRRQRGTPSSYFSMITSVGAVSELVGSHCFKEPNTKIANLPTLKIFKIVIFAPFPAFKARRSWASNLQPHFLSILFRIVGDCIEPSTLRTKFYIP